MLYQNVRGLNSKTLECLSSVLAQEHDFIALTETWLNDSVKDAELFDGRYIVFRRDRGSRGGGVLLAVRADRVLSARPLEYLHTVGEHLWINVELPRTSIIICVLYFPPTQNHAVSDAFFVKLQEECIHLRNKKIMILGDFNTIALGHLSSEVSYMCELYSLSDVNNVNNSFGKKLDLILTNLNCASTVKSNICIVPEDKYHPTLEVIFQTNSNNYNSTANQFHISSRESGWIFGDVDFVVLNSVLLGSSWGRVYECTDVGSALAVFYELVYSSFDECFRKKRPRINSRFYPKWFSSELVSILKGKYNAHKRWKKFNNPVDHNKFRSLRAQSKRLILSCHSNYIKICENALRNDPKSFWNFVNAKRTTQSKLSIMSKGSETFEGPESIAMGFAQHFQSVFSDSPSSFNFSDGCGLSSSPWSPTLIINEFDICDMEYGFKKLKSIRSFGPDLIPDFILKGCQLSLSNPLRFIYNLSLKTSSFPNSWKCTKVTPIHKKGDKSLIENYRPVAIVSSPAKLMEIILHKYIYHHVKPFLIDQQHGFRPARSTTTNLLSLSNFITKSMDSNVQVDVVYTDFKKAFDKVDHSILIRKLFDLGFSYNITELFVDYLSGRCQFVKYESQYSNEYPTFSGIPQGSNLGPLLFLIFINDIHTVISNSNLLLYADDLKVYRDIRTTADFTALQNDLNSLWEWASDNHLPFSIEKCHVVSYSRSLAPLVHPYSLGGNILEMKLSTSDLGITFESRWKFVVHISDICNRASKMLGFVMRNAHHFNDMRVLRLLYDTLVRSILESGSIIWNPREVKYNLQIERVQRKFLRYLYMRQYGYYPSLYPSAFVLGTLGYSTLSSRRDKLLVSHFCNLLRGDICNPPILEEMKLWAPAHFRESRTRQLFQVVRARTGVLADSPVARAIQCLNSLAQHFDIFCATQHQIATFLKQFKF
jgi:Reverse transcriptase (RNA-dependent DNA polymerase)